MTEHDFRDLRDLAKLSPPGVSKDLLVLLIELADGWDARCVVSEDDDSTTRPAKAGSVLEIAPLDINHIPSIDSSPGRSKLLWNFAAPEPPPHS